LKAPVRLEREVRARDVHWPAFRHPAQILMGPGFRR
jgi:hypothetical protein